MIKICEYCGKEHDGSYGLGRFCDEPCARGFATEKKRQEINEKVSKKLKGWKPKGKSFQKGYDPRRHIFTMDDRKRVREVTNRRRKEFYKIASWDELPVVEKHRRVLGEQDNKCICGLDTWLGKKLVLAIHHINGNTNDNSRENLVYLCPNCHSLTPNFCKKL